MIVNSYRLSTYPILLVTCLWIRCAVHLNRQPSYTEPIWKPGVQNFGIVTTIVDTDSTIPEFNVSLPWTENMFLENICGFQFLSFCSKFVFNIFYLFAIYFLIPADIEAECQDDYMKIRIGFNGKIEMTRKLIFINKFCFLWPFRFI